MLSLLLAALSNFVTIVETIFCISARPPSLMRLLASLVLRSRRYLSALAISMRLSTSSLALCSLPVSRSISFWRSICSCLRISIDYSFSWLWRMRKRFWSSSSLKIFISSFGFLNFKWDGVFSLFVGILDQFHKLYRDLKVEDVVIVIVVRTCFLLVTSADSSSMLLSFLVLHLLHFCTFLRLLSGPLLFLGHVGPDNFASFFTFNLVLRNGVDFLCEFFDQVVLA